jgi:UDP-N-acetylmuramyl tripeptide synthase
MFVHKDKEIIVIDFIDEKDTFDIRIMDAETESFENYEEFTRRGMSSEEMSKYIGEMAVHFDTTKTKTNIIKKEK